MFTAEFAIEPDAPYVPHYESANDLVRRWVGGYRYGFPDFYAAGFPVAPMYYDQSRIYQGVVGRHYPRAQTGRYHYLFDQNMYLQPGVPTFGLGQATDDETRKTTSRKIILGGVIGLAALAVAGVFAARSLSRASDRDEWDT
jgi:hypothetical protein